MKGILSRSSGGVAFDAIHTAMFSIQREPGATVIELIHAHKEVERFLSMAFGTVLPKCVVMRVLMTACAIIKLNASKCLEFFSIPGTQGVALLTIHLLVFSLKREIGVTVIKLFSRSEGFEIVA